MINVIKSILKSFRKKNTANSGTDSNTSTNNPSDDCQELIFDYPSYQNHEQVKNIAGDDEQKDISKPYDGLSRDEIIDMELELYFANKQNNERKSGTKVTDIER